MSGIFGWISHATPNPDSANEYLQRMTGENLGASIAMSHVFGGKSAMAGPSDKTRFYKNDYVSSRFLQPFFMQ